MKRLPDARLPLMLKLNTAPQPLGNKVFASS